MLHAIINRQLDAAERQLGASVDYMRHLARVSLGAFFRVALFSPMASYRKELPAAPYHLARLAAVVAEDCGTCVQIEVNLARKAGVPAEHLRAVLAGRIGDLPADLADAWHFARAVAVEKGGEQDARDRLRARFSETAIAEMAVGIAAARVYPTLKRGLGYAVSCSRVQVDI